MKWANVGAEHLEYVTSTAASQASVHAAGVVTVIELPPAEPR
jgi:hypothetical protein